MEQTPNLVYNPVEKTLSPVGMAAIMEEHADLYGGASRMAELLDNATDARTWNHFGTLLHLDVLDGVT